MPGKEIKGRSKRATYRHGGRVAKQLGGAIARPIARTLGYKKGARVYKKGGSAK